MCGGMSGKYYFSSTEFLVICVCDLKDKNKKVSIDYETEKEMV